jgi:hypothetical protein
MALIEPDQVHIACAGIYIWPSMPFALSSGTKQVFGKQQDFARPGDGIIGTE